mgnify:CR=1 FL=1
MTGRIARHHLVWPVRSNRRGELCDPLFASGAINLKTFKTLQECSLNLSHHRLAGELRQPTGCLQGAFATQVDCHEQTLAIGYTICQPCTSPQIAVTDRSRDGVPLPTPIPSPRGH